MIENHLSNEKNPGCLGCIGDYTTQQYKDRLSDSVRVLMEIDQSEFTLLLTFATCTETAVGKGSFLTGILSK